MPNPELHGHEHAIAAVVADLALRQQRPVVMPTWGLDDMTKLHGAHVRLVAVRAGDHDPSTVGDGSRVAAPPPSAARNVGSSSMRNWGLTIPPPAPRFLATRWYID